MKIISKMLLITLLVSMICFNVEAASSDVPSGNSFKAYMSYRAITKTGSPQYALQQTSITDANGLRMNNGAYCVAVGTGWGYPVGTRFTATLANGNTIPCVVGDIKAPRHTINNHKQAANGNILEFIVDTARLNTVAKNRGDISYIPGFEGEIVTMSAGASAPETVEEAIVTTAAAMSEEVVAPEVTTEVVNEPAPAPKVDVPTITAPEVVINEEDITVPAEKIMVTPEEPVEDKVVGNDDAEVDVDASQEGTYEDDDEEFIETSQEGTYKDEDEEYSQEGTYDTESNVSYGTDRDAQNGVEYDGNSVVLGKNIIDRNGTLIYVVRYSLGDLINDVLVSKDKYDVTVVGGNL